MKKIIKKITPRFLLSAYHFTLAFLGAIRYGFPSRKMVIIGVVGTRGKTTASNLIWSCLSAAGFKTGLIGTANLRIGDKERMNPFHMTMPGRFTIQKLLNEMKNAGCQIAIVETPSEGVEQWRHKGIFYDIAVLINLYPEYLAVHNWDFERCKKMDVVIFNELAHQPKKILNNHIVKKTIIVNADVAEKDMFLENRADTKVTYGIKNPADVKAEKITLKDMKARFEVNGLEYALGLIGAYNVQNALAAIATSLALEIPVEAVQKGIRISTIPGRMEEINEGQKFSVFVDYAHDAVSLESALSALREGKEKQARIIAVFGGQGGGRDIKKLPLMGAAAAHYADFTILTTDDPFDDDPAEINERIAKGAEENGAKRGESLFLILDRRDAIKKSFELARPGDVVIIAGKGAEQSTFVKGKKIPWDDRVVAREELKKNQNMV